MKTDTLPARLRHNDRENDPARPCRSCGVIVKRPDPARAEILPVRVHVPASRASGRPHPPTEIEVTRCDKCTERREHAIALLAAHPRVARVHGQVGIDRLDAALAALDLHGFRGNRIAALTGTDADLAQTIESLAPIGAAASWSASAGRVSATARRWGHVPGQLAQDAREAHKRLVHRLAEVATPCAPPGSLDGRTLPGCAFCGVGTLRVRESDAAAAWGDERRINADSLGGRPRPAPVVGHLCPRCRAAVEPAGAVGMPAVERALLRHHGYVLRSGYVLNFPRLHGWAALPLGAEPNTAPWQHLGPRVAANLADLERRGYLRRVGRP